MLNDKFTGKKRRIEFSRASASKFRSVFLLALLGLMASVSRADVSLPALFGDHMVLQREVPASIWGQAAPGENISLSVNNQTVRVVSDKDGRWQTQLPAQKAGGPFDLRVSGQNTLTLRDVYFGDVWLLSGQSNMEFGNKSILKPKVFAAESAAANDPELRFFSVKKNPQTAPTRDVGGAWRASTPQSMAPFSATGYFFGRALRRKLGVPIGLIGSYWGGTQSESFTSFEAMVKHSPELKAYWEEKLASYPANKQQYDEKTLPQWQVAADNAKAKGHPLPEKPRKPLGSPSSKDRPGALFNGMIAPLIPLSLKGVAWYQGESNADTLEEALAYQTLFPLLINDWRAQWKQELPFLWVQLANHRRVQKNPVEPRAWWPYAREAQTFALSLPATGMALAIDINDEPNNIHPSDKITTGERLAAVALATVYGENLPYTGPLFEQIQIEGSTVRVRFKHTDGGLKARGETLRGFAIAGKSGQFVWADARIDGEGVVLSSAQVTKPLAVRYSWADNPIGNLFNGAGLPASPFRSDIGTLPVTILKP